MLCWFLPYNNANQLYSFVRFFWHESTTLTGKPNCWIPHICFLILIWSSSLIWGLITFDNTGTPFCVSWFSDMRRTKWPGLGNKNTSESQSWLEWVISINKKEGSATGGGKEEYMGREDCEWSFPMWSANSAVKPSEREQSRWNH